MFMDPVIQILLSQNIRGTGKKYKHTQANRLQKQNEPQGNATVQVQCQAIPTLLANWQSTTGGNSLDIKVLEGPPNKLGWEGQMEGETHYPVAFIGLINQHQIPCHSVSCPLNVTEGWSLLLHYVGALTLIFTICGAPWRDGRLPERVKVHSRNPLHLQDTKEEG